MNKKSATKLPIHLVLVYQFLILIISYAVLRIGFYLFNQDLFTSVSIPKLLYMMMGGLKFDITALLYINIFYLFLQAVPFPFRYHDAYQLFCKWLFIITNGIGISLNLM